MKQIATSKAEARLYEAIGQEYEMQRYPSSCLDRYNKSELTENALYRISMLAEAAEQLKKEVEGGTTVKRLIRIIGGLSHSNGYMP